MRQLLPHGDRGLPDLGWPRVIAGAQPGAGPLHATLPRGTAKAADRPERYRQGSSAGVVPGRPPLVKPQLFTNQPRVGQAAQVRSRLRATSAWRLVVSVPCLVVSVRRFIVPEGGGSLASPEAPGAPGRRPAPVGAGRWAIHRCRARTPWGGELGRGSVERAPGCGRLRRYGRQSDFLSSRDAVIGFRMNELVMRGPTDRGSESSGWR